MSVRKRKRKQPKRKQRKRKQPKRKQPKRKQPKRKQPKRLSRLARAKRKARRLERALASERAARKVEREAREQERVKHEQARIMYEQERAKAAAEIARIESQRGVFAQAPSTTALRIAALQDRVSLAFQDVLASIDFETGRAKPDLPSEIVNAFFDEWRTSKAEYARETSGHLWYEYFAQMVDDMGVELEDDGPYSWHSFIEIYAKGQ